MFFSAAKILYLIQGGNDMSLIQISHLTFGYDGSYDLIFDDVSLQLDTNWKLGFTGRNGRGKTTFLKLLLGQYEYRGNISASVKFDYFPFDVTQKQRNTMEVIQEIAPECEYWQIKKELSLLDVGEDVLWQPYSQLSNGEQTKVLLSVLFLRENHFLLIDEPTNHLDSLGRKTVANYLKSKKGFILVSHDRQFLDDVIDHILSINKQNIDLQKGNFSTWQQNKNRQDSFEMAENEKLKREIHVLSESARKTANWSNKVEKTKKAGKNSAGIKPDKGYIGHKAAKMMKRSQCMVDRKNEAIEQKSKLLKNIEKEEILKLSHLQYHKQILLECKNVSLYYGEKQLFQPVTFSLERGDRIALQGGHGTGKTSILKWILGEKIAFEGQIQKGSGLEISYVCQDTSDLKGTLQQYAQKENIAYSLFLGILRKLGFTREQFDKNIEDFSAGQKKKVLLSKSLCQKAHLYIWDEPLNFIDVLSRIQIETLLLEYQPTMIFVEHDATFTQKIATKFVTIHAVKNEI